MADKGYSSKNNAAEIETLGAEPFIAFRSNTVEPASGTAWARMWHLFNYRRDKFLARYHRRSNVETVFAMIKAKFGDRLLAKSDVGQTGTRQDHLPHPCAASSTPTTNSASNPTSVRRPHDHVSWFEYESRRLARWASLGRSRR
ncbi:MAG: transposase [Actinobacteria bacterium]|nr:transposase [Actinomycetota bacterium]